jgi:hypothetical protein
VIDDPKMLAEHCARYSLEKGFALTTWDTVPIRVACIYREIDELVEAFELQSDSRAMEEISDVAGYALLMLHHLGNEDWNLRTSLHRSVRLGRFSTPDLMVRQLREYNGKVLENWRWGEGKRWEVLNSLQHLVTASAVLAKGLFQNTLDALVLSNLQKKAGRPERHGGKDARA